MAKAPNPLPAKNRNRVLGAVVGGIAVIAVLIVTRLLTINNVNSYIQVIILIAAVAYFAMMLTSKNVTSDERRGIVAYIPVFLALIVFWALLLQIFTTFAVFSAEQVDLNLFGWKVPPAWVITAQGVFASILSPVFTWLWLKLGNRQPSRVTKMAMGLTLMALGYGVFALLGGHPEARLPLIVVWSAFVFMAASEVISAPTGMSASSYYAPKAFPTQMMSLYYLTLAAGSSLSGTFGRMYTGANGQAYFTAMVALAAGAAVFVLVARWVLDRTMPRGDRPAR